MLIVIVRFNLVPFLLLTSCLPLLCPIPASSTLASHVLHRKHGTGEERTGKERRGKRRKGEERAEERRGEDRRGEETKGEERKEKEIRGGGR